MRWRAEPEICARNCSTLASMNSNRVLGRRPVDLLAVAIEHLAMKVDQQRAQRTPPDGDADGISAFGIEGEERRGLTAPASALAQRPDQALLLEFAHDLAGGIVGELRIAPRSAFDASPRRRSAARITRSLNCRI